MMPFLLKIAAIIAGWISLILGIIGIVVPGLPTTPFILLSAFLFARSSDRFHSWLKNNRFFGEIIHAWESDRAIPPGMKPKAITILVVTITISIITIPVIHAKIALGVICIGVGIFLYRLPEQKR